MVSVSSITGAQPGGSPNAASFAGGGARQTQLTPQAPDSVSFAGGKSQGQNSHLGIIGSLIACCAAVPVLIGLGAIGVGLYLARNTVGGLFKLAGKAGSGIGRLAKSSGMPTLNLPLPQQLPQVLYRP